MSMNNKTTVLFILATLILLCNSPNADSAVAPSPAVDCSSVILKMADCITYVSNDSKLTKPAGSCCSGLKTVLKTDPKCLCVGLKSSADFGIVLNITKAMTLPSACHVSAPPVSNCGINLGPAPASSPSLGTGELAPAPSPGNSASSMLAFSLVFLLLNLIIASFSLL